MIVADEESQFCESCLTVHSVTEFRRRFASRDIRLGQCRACHNQAERERRAAKRIRRDNTKLAKFANRLNRSPSRSRADLLCAYAAEELGGFAALAVAWVEQGKTACAIAPGSKRALDFFRSLIHLINICGVSTPNLEDLTDEDLECVMGEQLRRLIANEPELAIEAAEQLGWQVIPNA